MPAIAQMSFQGCDPDYYTRGSPLLTPRTLSSDDQQTGISVEGLI